MLYSVNSEALKTKSCTNWQPPLSSCLSGGFQSHRGGYIPVGCILTWILRGRREASAICTYLLISFTLKAESAFFQLAATLLLVFHLDQNFEPIKYSEALCVLLFAASLPQGVTARGFARHFCWVPFPMQPQMRLKYSIKYYITLNLYQVFL